MGPPALCPLYRSGCGRRERLPQPDARLYRVGPWGILRTISIRDLDVVSRESSATYQGRPVGTLQTRPTCSRLSALPLKVSCNMKTRLPTAHSTQFDAGAPVRSL